MVVASSIGSGPLLPEIVAALSAIAGTIGQLAAALSQLYLNASISAYSLIESQILLAALFNAVMFYAQNSPPPIPVPTDPSGGVIYYLLFRVFLYFEIRSFIRSGFSTIYWKFATNAEIILSESYHRYLKPKCIMSSTIIKGDNSRVYCFT
jgi:hypothetical protein